MEKIREVKSSPLSEGGALSKVFSSLQTDPHLSESGIMVESERKIAEYLTRSGIIEDSNTTNEARAKAERKRRQENYHNVQSFLEQFRCLRRTYEVFKTEFAEEIVYVNGLDRSILRDRNCGLFAKLTQELELMTVSDEVKFQNTFAPQIVAGKRIETAMNAMDFGLRILRAEDESAYSLINATYIEGETKPTVRDILTFLDYSSTSTYYQKLELARRKLTTAIFGYSSNRAELMSILVFLRQQTDDDYFPNYD